MSDKVLCEKFFRKLSDDLSSDWEKLATHCGFVSDEITSINKTYDGLSERSFQMLCKLWKRHPELTKWSGIIDKGLRSIQRMDLVVSLKEFLDEVKKQDVTVDLPDTRPTSTPQRLTPDSSSVKEPMEASGYSDKILKATPQDHHTDNNPEAPPGDLKMIEDIREDVSGKWFMKAWLERMLTKSVQYKNTYYFHCFLRDESGFKIYTSFFCKLKADCQKFFQLIKKSTKKKPLYLSTLKVRKEQDPRYHEKNRSTCNLIANENTNIQKV